MSCEERERVFRGVGSRSLVLTSFYNTEPLFGLKNVTMAECTIGNQVG